MDDKYMNLAFDNAKKAYDNDEVPVGCIIVFKNKVIASTYNQKESTNCSINHAEILAIIEASNYFNNWRLDNCDLYTTLDPCPMCASAIKQSRISNVYSANSNSDIENLIIIKKIFKCDKTNKEVNFITDLSPELSKNLLRNFFKNKRI